MGGFNTDLESGDQPRPWRRSRVETSLSPQPLTRPCACTQPFLGGCGLFPDTPRRKRTQKVPLSGGPTLSESSQGH